MESQLDWLYSQYKDLVSTYADVSNKIDKVASAIKAFGGEVPSLSDIQSQNVDVYEIITGLSEEMFPLEGTWKDKILFTLKRLGRPVFTSDIVKHILETEARHGYMRSAKTNINSVLAQVCSKMAIDGEIGVDNSGFKNKYFLKQE